MKIAISGAHSTGKTTLIETLRVMPQFKDYEFFSNITRQLKEQGFKINEAGNDATQLKMMEIHAENANKDINAIYDRCIMDPLAYTIYLNRQGQVSAEATLQTWQAFSANIGKYDVIFYLEPEFEIVDDGVRATDSQFRNDILEIFNFIIKMYEIPVICLTGSVQERVQQILNVLKDPQYANK